MYPDTPSNPMQFDSNIKAYIAARLRVSGKCFPYAAAASFPQEEMVDSLGIGGALAFVRSTFGIVVPPAEWPPANFDPVVAFAALVRCKRFALAGRA
jgi:hypothetical protein